MDTNETPIATKIIKEGPVETLAEQEAPHTAQHCHSAKRA
jgi:hypothetical protein